MKRKNKLLFIIIVLTLLLSLYWSTFYLFGNLEKTVVNQPVNTIITMRPRLEDDFYEYVNYEYLSKDMLSDDKIGIYAFDQTDKIEEEKKIIINEIMKSQNDIGNKMKYFYDSYIESTEEENIKELNVYIDKINNSANIKEFVENVIEVNYRLDTDILLSPNILYNMKGDSTKYFSLDLITYDWDNTLGYYTIEEFQKYVRMYKKYNVQILKKYGFSPNEAIVISDNVQSIYKKFSMFSELNQNNLLDDGYKIYTVNELKEKLENIPIDILISYYPEFVDENDEILVADINQLLQVDKCLKEENLDILKNYAMLKILTTYSKYLSEDYYQIYYDYISESQNYVEREEQTKEEIIYGQMYLFFGDTIIEKFAEKHFTKEQQEFYTNLIKEEIDVYKSRIKSANWLTDETKGKALKKLEEMTYIVGIPKQFVKVENSYKIDLNETYISNIINMRHNMKNEEMRQYKLDNILYNNPIVDQLTVNAYYLSNNNSMNLLLGYIYSMNEVFKYENFEEDYYKILGSIGVTVGHELSHALDNNGAKYDEYGNYINWWTEEDKYNFNILTGKVVRYYNKYDQFGDTTLGENIADLGGMAIVLQIAENKNATEENYKELFEAYAMTWASQETSVCKEYLLINDEHSPAKNRVNAVLSTFDKFYEIYEIKDSDEMYVRPEDRVAIW